MPVLRVNKTKDYTVMSNSHLRNRQMSLKAKGLLSVMLSLPDNWEYSIKGLVAICKEQENAIVTALNELKELGYLKVEKLSPNQTKSGRIEYVYHIYESPLLSNPSPHQEKDHQSSESVSAEILSPETQQIENPPLYQKKDIENMKKTKKENQKENPSPLSFDPLSQLSGELRKKTEEWIQYKQEKHQAYRPTGLKSLVAQIQAKSNQYGDFAVIDLMGECMSANYQGILWDRLEKQSSPYSSRSSYGSSRSSSGSSRSSSALGANPFANLLRHSSNSMNTFYGEEKEVEH